MLNSSLVKFFAEAESNGPIIHITPSELFKFEGYSVTNSMLYGLIASVLIAVFLVYAGRKMTVRPKRGIIQFIEIGTEFIISTIQGAMGSRKKAIKYAPIFTATFFFVMFSNWLGMIPGAGEALTYGGQPIIRPYTADLNATLAASLIMMVLVQYFAIKESGFLKYIRHFFAGKLWNPATYLLGVFEVFSEFTKIFSLALRLFLNVAVGETIIVIFMYLGRFAAPITALPIMLLELFIGALQAYIFTMLTIMYLSAAIAHNHDVDELERHELAKAASAK